MKYLLLLSFLITTSSYAQKKGHEWKKYTADRRCISYYYDKNTIKEKAKNVYSIWTKREPSNESTLLLTRQEKVKETGNEKYWGYIHTLEKSEINCLDEKTIITDIFDYNENGEVLSISHYKESEWTTLVPETMGYDLLETVCSKNKEPLYREEKKGKRRSLEDLLNASDSLELIEKKRN